MVIHFVWKEKWPGVKLFTDLWAVGINKQRVGVGAQHKGTCTHRSPKKPGMLSPQDCLSNGKDVKKKHKKTKTMFSHPESWKLEVISSLASVLSFRPGHIKLIQPGPEMAGNLNDRPLQPRDPQAPTTKTRETTQSKWLLHYLFSQRFLQILTTSISDG